ncbi:MAG TPA: hypothetical protein VFW87_17785 [Pirellulales bacterium]|nr:hypothetical protein [Pirellulales bacterium]
MRNDQDSPANEAEAARKRPASATRWWSTFIVAVLAVPTLVCLMARVVPLRGAGQLVAFMLACWLCTYLGMVLMEGPERKGSSKGDRKQPFNPSDLW